MTNKKASDKEVNVGMEVVTSNSNENVVLNTKDAEQVIVWMRRGRSWDDMVAQLGISRVQLQQWYRRQKAIYNRLRLADTINLPTRKQWFWLLFGSLIAMEHRKHQQ